MCQLGYHARGMMLGQDATSAASSDPGWATIVVTVAAVVSALGSSTRTVQVARRAWSTMLDRTPAGDATEGATSPGLKNMNSEPERFSIAAL